MGVNLVKLSPCQQKVLDLMADGYVLVQYADKKAKVCLQLRGMNKKATNKKCTKATMSVLVQSGLIIVAKNTKIRTTYKLASVPEALKEVLEGGKKSEDENKDPATGQFVKGNNAWERRAKTGRNKLFDDPDVLWEAAKEYFDWIVANPLKEGKVFVHQGRVTRTHVNRMQAMTLDGLTMFLGIGIATWNNYRKDPDFLWVVEDVETIIRNQKFVGAAADMLNANIIARDLGLKDSTTAELTGPGGGPIVTQNLDATPEDVYKMMAEMNKGKQ